MRNWAGQKSKSSAWASFVANWKSCSEKSGQRRSLFSDFSLALLPSLCPSLGRPSHWKEHQRTDENETKTKSDVQQFEHVSVLSKPLLALTCWHGTHIRTRSEKFIQNTYILCTISIVVHRAATESRYQIQKWEWQMASHAPKMSTSTCAMCNACHPNSESECDRERELRAQSTHSKKLNETHSAQLTQQVTVESFSHWDNGIKLKSSYIFTYTSTQTPYSETASRK